MQINKSELSDLREICLDYYSGEKPNIRSIILYGGAAKNYAGHDHIPGDFDLNVFFSDQASISSTFGMPKILPNYNGMKVEVMRNTVPERMTIKQYVETQNSKRWHRIREEPIVQIHPEIKRLKW